VNKLPRAVTELDTLNRLDEVAALAKVHRRTVERAVEREHGNCRSRSSWSGLGIATVARTLLAHYTAEARACKVRAALDAFAWASARECWSLRAEQTTRSFSDESAFASGGSRDSGSVVPRTFHATVDERTLFGMGTR
jgi:hypothetical protein